MTAAVKVLGNSINVDGWTCYDYPNPPLDSDGNVWVWREIEGWYGGLAPRGATIARPLLDGDMDGPAPFSGRTIVVSGTLVATSRRALQIGMDRLARVLATTVRRAALTVDETEVGLIRTAEVRLGGATMITRSSTYTAEWSINLFAADTARYGSTTKRLVIAPFVEGGGRVYDLTFPRTYGTSGVSGRGVAHNSGDRITYPVVQFFGPNTNPSLNVVGGNKIQLLMKLNSGDVATIDNARRTVFVNGASRRQYLSADSRWIGLAPGDTALFFQNTSGTGDCVVTWQDAWS